MLQGVVSVIEKASNLTRSCCNNAQGCTLRIRSIWI